MVILSKIKSLPFIAEIVADKGIVYTVGGAVRDNFLGRESKDLDIVVRGIPASNLLAILRKYGSAKEQMVGNTFAMIKFTANGAHEEIDIALPRTERKIGEGYQGFEINADHNISIEQDLLRRDFTINSIAMDLDGNITDPFRGQQDLHDKIIRVTNPVAFQEDPLRMLRAVQFASRFGFSIEPETMKMIQEKSPSIVEITGERILLELEKIVSKGNPLIGTQLLAETGLYPHIFGNADLFPGSWVAKATRMSEFIYLLTFQIMPNPEQFFKSQLKGDLNTAAEIKAFMKASEEPQHPVDCCQRLFEITRISATAVQSFIVTEMFKYGSMVRHMKAANMPFSFKELALNGEDLISVGIQQGPEQGKILRNLLTLIYSGNIQNQRKALLDYVNSLVLEEVVGKSKF